MSSTTTNNTAATKVAVLGATGQQGGAVARALAAATAGGPAVVALTRNPDGAAATALKTAGIASEVRRADLDDVESLVTALQGCDGVFVISNFWEGMDVTREMQQYKNAAEAIRRQGPGVVKHVVFSTLEETTLAGVTDDFKTLVDHAETGPMKVPHFDGKARAEAYYADLPTTFLNTSCYLENFGSFFSFTKVADTEDTYTFTLPLSDKKVPWTILPDLGRLVAAIFAKPELIGQRVGQASLFASGEDLAEIFSQATGKTIRYNCVSWETFAAFGFPGAVELAQMFESWLRILDDFNNARSLERQAEITDGAVPTDPVEYAKTITLKFEG